MVGGMTVEGVRRSGDKGTFAVSILVYGVQGQTKRQQRRQARRL